MFAPTFGRAVRSGSTTPGASGRFTHAVFGCGQSQSCLRPDMQRRFSSSKPPIPPKNNKTEAAEGSEPCASQRTQRSKKRKLRAAVPAKKRSAPSFQNLPWIPPTDHLLEKEVKLLSFLAQDGPLPTHFDPWTRGNPDIDALFRPTSAHERHVMNHVIETVESSIRGYSNAIEAFQERHDSDEIASWLCDRALVNRPLHQQYSHGLPTADELNIVLARIPPYMPPPPPSAIVQPIPQKTPRKHVARRHGIYMISVKRQRKLKMKKHKYKKLMKRTRLLRRKLDRN